MPKPNVIIGVVGVVLTPAAVLSGTVASFVKPNVRFAHGATAFFDLENLSEASRQAGVLEALQRTGWPAHVEVRSDGVIEAVRMPDIGRVLRVAEIGGGVYAATLDRSEMRFFIEGSQHDALRVLQSAVGTDVPILIARNAGGWIVDVQPLPTYVVFDTPPFGRVRCGPEIIASTSILDAACDSDELVAAMMAHTCALPEADADCIPFLYVERGCFARAHRMCELLADRGVDAAKLWLFGDLCVETPNRTECHVPWSSHVAPFVRVDTTRGPEIRVIDPSIFRDRAVSLDEWIDAHNDPTAVPLYSDASIFFLTETGFGRLESTEVTGRGLRETIVDLQDFRTELLRMNPAPPFDHCCPTAPQTIAESSGQEPAEPTPE